MGQFSKICFFYHIICLIHLRCQPLTSNLWQNNVRHDVKCHCKLQIIGILRNDIDSGMIYTLLVALPPPRAGRGLCWSACPPATCRPGPGPRCSGSRGWPPGTAGCRTPPPGRWSATACRDTWTERCGSDPRYPHPAPSVIRLIWTNFTTH